VVLTIASDQAAPTSRRWHGGLLCPVETTGVVTRGGVFADAGGAP